MMRRVWNIAVRCPLTVGQWMALGPMLAIAGSESIEGTGQDNDSAGQAITQDSQEAQSGM